MAVGRFASAQALAQRLIGKNGEKSTLVRGVDGTPSDPTKPWEPGVPTVTSLVVDAVWFVYQITRLNRELIQDGDQEVWVPALALGSLVPDNTTDIMVRVDDSRWQIINVEPLQPNEEQIVYRLQCRRQAR